MKLENARVGSIEVLSLCRHTGAVCCCHRQGTALLVVLLIVMTVTIVSLGVISRSDVEMACGQNMILRTQMDYLAESGLEHTKGLILNPQDISSEYWQGDVGQQLVAGSDDYYDVGVVKLGECNYQITSTAYRQKGGEQVGRSSLIAEIRLDPCIAFWTGNSTTITPQTTIIGDVYCGGTLSNGGYIGGDVFAAGTITGANSVGQSNESVAEPPVSWSGLEIGDLAPAYYYDGSGPYQAKILESSEYGSADFPGPGLGNPACVYYRSGDLKLCENINITGTVVVSQHLILDWDSNITITAVKNFPALLVGQQVKMQNDGQGLTVNGLAQVGEHVDMADKIGRHLDVFGALYILGDGIINTSGCTVNITAAPNKAAIEIWPELGIAQRWSPAAGAFFRNVIRE